VGTISGEAAQVHHDDAVGGLCLAVRLWMESRCHVQLGAHKLHELAPERRSENQVTVGNDGLRNAMEANNVGEEGMRHRRRRVRVCKGDEVAVLAEPVDDGENDRLLVHPLYHFHEVETDVGLDRRQHGQRHKQPRWV
jgi:hypothetical protein